jgi:hypothetical protein
VPFRRTYAMLFRGITVEVRYDTCRLEELMLCYV